MYCCCINERQNKNYPHEPCIYTYWVFHRYQPFGDHIFHQFLFPVHLIVLQKSICHLHYNVYTDLYPENLYPEMTLQYIHKQDRLFHIEKDTFLFFIVFN